MLYDTGVNIGCAGRLHLLSEQLDVVRRNGHYWREKRLVLLWRAPWLIPFSASIEAGARSPRYNRANSSYHATPGCTRLISEFDQR